MEIILLYQNPLDHSEWLPLPTPGDLLEGTRAPATFPNGTQVKVHGKLYERIGDPDAYTYLNVDGIPNMTVNLTFDGELVPGSCIITLNDPLTKIEPFEMGCNGTFEFLLDINKPAGVYELAAHFAGFPTTGPRWYDPLDHTTIVHVSHPTLVALDALPTSIVVGETLSVTGTLEDDTDTPIPSVPLRVLLDGELLGPASDGIYIDDVEVTGADFSDDLESEGDGGWTSYAASDRDAADQWEHGAPGANVGPPAARSGTRLWGTMLGGDYARGSWSFLVSPVLNLSDSGSYRLSFWAWWSICWEDDIGYVLCSTDGGATWDETNPLVFTGSMLASAGWERFELDLTGYAGSDDVRVAFVLRTADWTTVVSTDGSFRYDYVVPMGTEADRHTVSVEFTGNLLFRASSSSRTVNVKRIVHLEFEQNLSRKVGYRNERIMLVAWLRDNEGEVPKGEIDGVPQGYTVFAHIHTTWDADGDGDSLTISAGRVNRTTGEVYIYYVVAWDQTLGPAGVVFRFDGSDFYTAAEERDVYYVKAHTYIRLVDEGERRCTRGQPFDFSGELRVVSTESIVDKVAGDPLLGEFILLYIDGEYSGSRRTGIDGSFSTQYMVPSTLELGDLLVHFRYQGQSVYEAFGVHINYTVASRTSITIPSSQVYKGNWAWINGTITDDIGDPVPNAPIYIIWKRAPEIGRATSKSDGKFSLQYYIEYEGKVGNVTVIARFKGAPHHDPSEANATFIIKVNTLIQRPDRVVSVLRGDQMTISCKLYEDWGGIRGVEVVRAQVIALINDIELDRARTSFDGIATFVVPIDPDHFPVGAVTLTLIYNGTEFFDPSYLDSPLTIRFHYLSIFEGISVNGEPYEIASGVLRRNDTLRGRVLVEDDAHRPLNDLPISIYCLVDEVGGQRRLITSGITDVTGRFGFEHRLTFDNDCTVYIFADVAGMEDLTIVEQDGRMSLPFSGWLRFTYIVPPLQTIPDLVRTNGDRVVSVGDALELRVRPRDAGMWDSDNLTYSLVSPPAGMEIAPDGTITWIPSGNQSGRHTITLWLYDGSSSRSADIEVTVTDEDAGLLSGASDILVVVFGALAIIILIGIRSAKWRKHGPSG